GTLIDFVDDQKRSPISRAVEGGHADTVQLILSNYPRLDPADQRGHTPLMKAVLSKNEPVVDL
ncbi:hypothetical protein BCR34DRAFT_450687, partial [Clohesyomyces aquaticus]